MALLYRSRHVVSIFTGDRNDYSLRRQVWAGSIVIERFAPAKRPIVREAELNTQAHTIVLNDTHTNIALARKIVADLDNRIETKGKGEQFEPLVAKRIAHRF
jgi:hypothetical protein